jgi:hypothetical protein
MALAMLEALAHITMVNQKRGYCRMVLEAPSNSPAGGEQLPDDTDIYGVSFIQANLFKQIDIHQLPEDFRSNPGPDALRAIGDAFIAEGKFLALKVPSVVVPDSFNFLLNPGHALFKELIIENVQQVSFDQRPIRPGKN